MNCKSSRFQFSCFLRIHSFSSEWVFRYSWINFAKDFAITEGILIPGNKRTEVVTRRKCRGSCARSYATLRKSGTHQGSKK